ncbi:MAG: hypothetical protein NTV12_07275 [Verrucomicrobia bacterium]|nr:hypothetical protein [Verrucomicrobiota bacterium]
MRITVMVILETYRTGTGKKSGERYEMLTLRCVDKSLPKEARCKSLLEITLAKEDLTYRGSLEDEVLDLDILEIKGEFGGCVQGNGKVFRV